MHGVNPLYYHPAEKLIVSPDAGQGQPLVHQRIGGFPLFLGISLPLDYDTGERILIVAIDQVGEHRLQVRRNMVLVTLVVAANIAADIPGLIHSN